MLAIPVDISFLFAVFSECRFSVSAPESHRSVGPLAPIGEVVAESYPIRTVIQFSICPSIGRQREGPEINPLNNQLGTFLPFAQKNFCKLFVNDGYNDKKSRYTAHQISGRKSLAISLMKLCTGSEIQKPSMSAFSVPQADAATGTAQPQFLSAAAVSDSRPWVKYLILLYAALFLSAVNGCYGYCTAADKQQSNPQQKIGVISRLRRLVGAGFDGAAGQLCRYGFEPW